MFGFITRTERHKPVERAEHDRVVAERDDALHLIDKQARDIARMKDAAKMLSEALKAKDRLLAKVHTTRGPGGRFVKREERQS